MLLPIRKMSSKLISLWKSSAQNAHGRMPPTITAKVLKTAAPVVLSAVVTASSTTAPHFVANSGDGVNPVVDPETDPERNHRDGVNRQSDVTRVHVHEGAEVRHHARYDEEQAGER